MYRNWRIGIPKFQLKLMLCCQIRKLNCKHKNINETLAPDPLIKFDHKITEIEESESPNFINLS